MTQAQFPLGAALARTHALAFTHPKPWSAAAFSGLLASPGIILTGEPNAFVLGRVVLDEAEVLTVATAPQSRRQGLARAALTLFERHAKAAGAVAIFLEVAEDNEPARALYHSSGFAQVGRRPHYYATLAGTAVAALLLRKSL